MTAPACAICLDQLYGNYQEVAVVTSCGHSFHSACIFQAHARDQRCPSCRGPIPDRGSISRIAFDNEDTDVQVIEANSDQDNDILSEDDDESMGSEDSEDDDRSSNQERAFNDLSRAFAEQAIRLRRVQEEKDKMSRKLSQKNRKIKDLEDRIRVLKMRNSSTDEIRRIGRSQPSNSHLRFRTRHHYDQFRNFDSDDFDIDA